MVKTTITRTLGPIHFEDLDPHRFEDLVRQLVYDFRHWQTIESTGRGGADGGFDIRAYEVLPAPAPAIDNEEDQEDVPHPMEGNPWMIQCKREKELGPKRVHAIVSEAVNCESLPYGYILAAPANFSKAAHDKFREELRNGGVMEFYLWGAGELEDMLYQPKNDHILFAFFGISLTSRRRSRATTIRATVNAKNKLLRVLRDDPHHQPVLLRDLKDTSYPYEDEYNDFEKRPRWKVYGVVEIHPLGLIVSIGAHYAYIDKTKGEWDFTKAVNTVRANGNPRQHNIDDHELKNSVKGFWEQFPRRKQALFIDNALVRFDSMVFIDDKGDNEYKFPHVYVDFHNEKGPFSGGQQYLEINKYHSELLDGLKRASIFPKTFPKPSFGTLYKDKSIVLDDRTTRRSLQYNSGSVTLYDVDKKYAFLRPMDVISVEKSEDKDGKRVLLKITSIGVAAGKDLLDLCKENPPLKQEIEDQLGRTLKARDKVYVTEAMIIHDWQIEQNRPIV